MQWLDSVTQFLSSDRTHEILVESAELAGIGIVFFLIFKYSWRSLLSTWMRAVKNPSWKAQLSLTKEKTYTGFSSLLNISFFSF